MPRKKKDPTALTPSETARLNEAIANYPRVDAPKDVYLSGPSEQEEKLDAEAQKALDRAENARSSASDRELEVMRERLAELEKKNALLELEQKAVFGDYSQMDPFHPFEVMIHTHEEPAKNFDVDVVHNGTKYTFKRGVPRRVPKCVVDILADAKIKGATRVINPATGNPETFVYDQNRFQYNARPLPA